MSGGEQQRVAIARALVNQPKVLFADEPSGNLDSKTKGELHRLFFDLRDRFGITIVIVTHDLMVAKELNCKITFLSRKKLTEPHSFDTWLNGDSEITKELFRDLRNSG